MTLIHPTAIVDPSAKLAENVAVGPYCVIGPHVQIGARTRIASHGVIEGHTTIGEDNEIGIGAVIGLAPQDLHFKDEISFVKIGQRNKIREYVQIHRGTQEGSSTVLGDDNFLLGFSHVAHNCCLGSGIIVANGALLAGHVIVEDGVFISGLCLVHQHTRLGRYAMMRGGSRISLDLPPYTMADNANEIRGINTVGLSRRNFSSETIRSIKTAYRDIYFSGRPVQETLKEKLAGNLSSEVKHFLEFIQQSKNGICRPKNPGS